MTEAYAETSVSGEPFAPVHGSGVTAAEMIFDVPSAVRSDLKNDSRLAASADEYGFPAPDSLGYSCEWSRPCQGREPCLEKENLPNRCRYLH